MNQKQETKKSEKKKLKKEFTYEIKFVDPPEGYDFDMEQWLAEILVDHYLKNKSERT